MVVPLPASGLRQPRAPGPAPSQPLPPQAPRPVPPEPAAGGWVEPPVSPCPQRGGGAGAPPRRGPLL